MLKTLHQFLDSICYYSTLWQSRVKNFNQGQMWQAPDVALLCMQAWRVLREKLQLLLYWQTRFYSIETQNQMKPLEKTPFLHRGTDLSDQYHSFLLLWLNKSLFQMSLSPRFLSDSLIQARDYWGISTCQK